MATFVIRQYDYYHCYFPVTLAFHLVSSSVTNNDIWASASQSMSSHYHPSRPYISIPQPPPGILPSGAQRPTNPSPSTRPDPWAFEVTPPPFAENQHALHNPWGEENGSPNTLRHRTLSLINLPSDSSRPPSRVSSIQASTTNAPLAFPEPQIYRSVSQRVSGHKPSASDISAENLRLRHDPSVASFRSTQSTNSWYYDDDYGSISNEVGTENRMVVLAKLIQSIVARGRGTVIQESLWCLVCLTLFYSFQSPFIYSAG